MKVWVTRDNNTQDWVAISRGKRKPYTNSYGQFTSCGVAIHEDVEKFKKIFGFTPRKGTCEQYELSLKEIEE